MRVGLVVLTSPWLVSLFLLAQQDTGVDAIDYEVNSNPQRLRGSADDNDVIDQELLAAFPDYYEILDPDNDWGTVEEEAEEDDNNPTHSHHFNHTFNHKDHRALQSCTPVALDFNSAPDGMPLNGNEYVRKDWVPTLGVSIRAAGIGGGFTPSFVGRLLDSERPAPANNIGSPNNNCPFRGQGSGVGGRPSAAGQPPNPGENCDHLGNVLIIQDDADTSVTKDYPGGGFLNFYFTEPTYVKSIGLLDIDTSAAYVRVFRTGNKHRTYKIRRLGDNSFQEIAIERAHIFKIHVFFKGNGAVSKLSFCPPVLPPVLPPPDVPAECESETTVYEENFESTLMAPDGGWTNGNLDGMPSFTTFLGRFSNGDEYPWRLFTIPTYMDRVEIRFRFYEIDSWNAPDSLAVMINGEVVSLGEFDAQVDEGTRSGQTASGITWETISLGLPQDLGFTTRRRFYPDQRHDVLVVVPRSFYGVEGKLYVQLQTIVTGRATTDESGGFDDFVIKAFFDCSSITAFPSFSPSESISPSESNVPTTLLI